MGNNYTHGIVLDVIQIHENTVCIMPNDNFKIQMVSQSQLEFCVEVFVSCLVCHRCQLFLEYLNPYGLVVLFFLQT